MSELGQKHYRTSLIVGGHSGGHRRKLLEILYNKTCAKVRKTPYFVVKYGVFGGDKRDRTADLLNAILYGWKHNEYS